MEKERAPEKDLYEGRLLTREEVSYKRNAQGNVESLSNNLWMNLQMPSEETNSLLGATFFGETFAEKINDATDKERFLELSNKLGEVASWKLQGKERWDAITSKEANDIYFEMYSIARRYGISNSELIR